jgi:signal transduction histidine kinase
MMSEAESTPATTLRVLFVEDSDDDVRLIVRQLERAGYRVESHQVQTPDGFDAAIENARWDVVISDHSMPHFSSADALAAIKAHGLDWPFIIVSGTIGEEMAVEAMRAGAHDYVLKNNLVRLAPAIERELNDAELRRQARAEREARRAVERQLQEAQKMEAVGRLAGGIAHDFNNLLTAISGYGELALMKLDGAPAREYVEEMQRASERAAQLTRQLLAFSRRQVLQFEVVDLNAVVADLERMLARLLGVGIELDVRLDASLAPTKADPGQLQQVVLNLALNARDAMPDGGTLAIATANVGPNVVLTVSDTGEGMDEETLARVFEPFFTTKPAGEGTGLGLATVYGIVKQTGGDVSVRSARGSGTIFEVSLPRSNGAVADRGDADVPEAEEAEATLLLVEDEDVVRRLAAEMLRGAGYRVLEASNGTEAMAIAREEEIDVLLSDVVMAGMSGPQVAQELRRNRPELRVLFMSGYTADAIASHGDLPANTSFLPKPFTRAALLGALGDLRREALVASG